MEIPSITPVQQDALLLDFAAARNGTNGSSHLHPARRHGRGGRGLHGVSGTSNAAIELSALALSSNAATGLARATVPSSPLDLHQPDGLGHRGPLGGLAHACHAIVQQWMTASS